MLLARQIDFDVVLHFPLLRGNIASVLITREPTPIARFDFNGFVSTVPRSVNAMIVARDARGNQRILLPPKGRCN